MDIMRKIGGVFLLLVIIASSTNASKEQVQGNDHDGRNVIPAESRVKRQIGYYDPYYPYDRVPVPIPIFLGGGGFLLGGRGFGGRGFGGRGFGGRGFGGRGFGGRGFGGRGFGGRGIGGRAGGFGGGFGGRGGGGRG